jgi:Protein of unknown function (DUF1553)/Protein of unknown function (DUF1549)/Planctomycete cytochrome C
MRNLRVLACAGLLLALPVSSRGAAPVPDRAGMEFFEKKVRPLLASHCLACHGPTKQRGGLRLDSRAALLKGSDLGPVVVPGHPEKSGLLKAVRHEGDIKMPPKGKLPAEAVADLEQWVKMGVPWADAGPATRAVSEVSEARKTHWGFRPVHKPVVPATRDTAWPVTDIDRFVLARLEAKGLKPSSEADRRTLIRRLSFDLLGLPPTPDEVEAFVRDTSPTAYERLIDRLLASPHYGERWGRHWLDVARYADTKGYVFQEERRFPFAYTYRDYVIQAFNEDKPYDRFVLEQLAADRLNLGDDKEPLAAMGFLTLGRRFLNNTNDIIDDRIDVTMRGLQGLTVACARCHDHKFDPIPQKDYYSLYGVFASSVEPPNLPVIASPRATPEYLAFQKELEKRQKAVDDFAEKNREELRKRNRKFRDGLRALQRKVDQLKVTHPGAPPSAMVLVDSPRPVQPVVFLRGNPRNRGPVVPRQAPEVIAGEKRKPFTDGSGRLELARAIASPDNPLTARVMVNRIWHWHFGQGIVRTPSDFGLRGEPPTHPELLDYLASTFVENGWSIKKLHKLILMSRVYRQKSDDRKDGHRLDIDNRLLWRMNRQRLDFEAMRDSILAVAGRLDRKLGGPPVNIVDAPFATRRSVYGFIDRQNLPGLFRTFDLASPDAHTPMRHQTTVPQQALFLMNSPFLIEQARHLAARPDVARVTDPGHRIGRFYRLLFGRSPGPDETALGLRFLAGARKRASGDRSHLGPWEQYAQVLLLSNEMAFVD